MPLNRDEEGRTVGRTEGRRRSSRSAPSPKSGPEWWVKRWQGWVNDLGLIPAAAAATGARIKRLEIGPGVVNAVVQDRNQEQCAVEIRFTLWSEAQWQAAMDAIAEQAMFAAQLLSGELPPELDGILQDADAPLLPARAADVSITCEGPACKGGKCPHAAVIFGQLGEALTDDPWMLLRMRGRDQTQVLAALRKVRTKPAESGYSATPSAAPTPVGRFHRHPTESAPQEDVPSLESQLASYWGATKTLESYRPHFHEPKVDAVLLRRLGPLPLSGPDDDIYEDLSAIYRRVSHAAVRRAFAAEPDQDR